MRALDVTDERRRPRQSNFGSLSAGMVVRGSVPAELLTAANEPDAVAAEAPPGIIALANRRHAERRERAAPARLDAALLHAERTRPRESTFASLTGDMVERGKVSRDILNAAQIALLLQPEPVAPQELLSQADEPAVEENEAADEQADVAAPEAAAEDIPDDEVPPYVVAAAVVPVELPVPLDAPTLVSPHLNLLREPEPALLVAESSAVAAKPRRSVATWFTCLASLLIIGVMPFGELAPPASVPMTIVVAPATEAEEPDPLPPATAEAAAPETRAAPTMPAAEAGEDDDETTTGTPAAPVGIVAPVEIRRQRPGATQDDDLPLPVFTPPCFTPRACAGDDR